jgi:hypothetical protein
MAMQGLLSSNDLLTFLCDGSKEVPISEIVLNNADIIATALVNRLKEDKIMKYTHSKIENLYLYLYPFGIEFNSKPSLFMRFILWMVGFKKYKEEEK